MSEKSARHSLTLQSAAAIAIAAVAARFNVALPDGFAQELAAALIDLVMTLALLGVAVGRARAKGPLA